MPANWKQEVSLFLGATGAAGGVGALLGWLLPGLLLGLLSYIGWHLHHILRLPRLLGEDTSHEATESFGLWKTVHEQIRQLREINRTREHGLANSLGRFRAAVSALPDAVVILDQHGTIEWSNPAAQALLGIDSAKSSGQYLSQQVNEPLLDEYLATGDYSQPLIFSAPGSRTRILSLLVTALASQQRQMLVVSDITHQYHLGEAKRDFVANVSHELRTPLTVVSGLLEQMVLGDIDAKTRQRMTELMQHQAERMRELIADLLTLSRLESKDPSLRDQHVAVPELLEEIIEEARTLSANAGHVLQLHIQSPDGLHGNAMELRAAFANLVTNAIKHTPNRAEIHVHWSVDAAGAHLSVRDTGEGIPARHIPRLTERLYRVDASRSRDTGGTGLGLAIVKHALDQHAAKLEIRSAVGRGSTFTCHFPVDRVIVAGAGQSGPNA